jgi:hypothetical protein
MKKNRLRTPLEAAVTLLRDPHGKAMSPLGAALDIAASSPAGSTA